jgi:hypothetical protein
MVRRWCGTVGASIGQQRRVPSACRASARFGLRCGVAVIAHAQHQHINRRQLGQQAIGLLGSVFKVGGGAVEAEELRLGRRALQQVRFSRPALLSACSTGTQRSSARLTVTFDQSRPAWPGAGKSHRAAATGHHQRRLPRALMAARNCSATSWPGLRPTGGRAELMGSDALRQFQFRYRHTTTSHPA